MSDPKKELTPEQLGKVAGGRGSSTSASSSHSARPSSSTSSFSAHKAPLPYRPSSSTSK